MKRERLPEIDELFRSLQKEKSKLNLKYFLKVINPKRDEIVDIEAVYTWDIMDDPEHNETSDLLNNLKKKN